MLALAGAVAAFAGAAAWADDTAKPSDDPDPGFLEFLGSVDRLAEVNPDYLSQAGAPGNPPHPAGTRVAAPPGPATTPPSPPPPPQQPLPPSADASGAKNNE